MTRETGPLHVKLDLVVERGRNVAIFIGAPFLRGIPALRGSVFSTVIRRNAVLTYEPADEASKVKR